MLSVQGGEAVCCRLIGDKKSGSDWSWEAGGKTKKSPDRPANQSSHAGTGTPSEDTLAWTTTRGEKN